ncbi:hypothetical protein DICVIV_13497 [Dictyocaulus viviparus]|uniref:CX domain-containing protein n=1 Tax=Dictyocaulus viviparus TaxID=29172 RepID=A0A0D8X7L6_DICVI|nr:hypothetical protein DICVIV_13497 [Dictyocaulus viviparus]
MTANRSRSWSRWSALDDVSMKSPHHDNTAIRNIVSPLASSVVQTVLLDKKINAIDPSFYDCLYNTSLGETIIERCYKDIGCCSTTCCSSDEWKWKYAWAITLTGLFCVLVIIALVIQMILWLVNRKKDKNQKRLLKSSRSSRTNSNMSFSGV